MCAKHMVITRNLNLFLNEIYLHIKYWLTVLKYFYTEKMSNDVAYSLPQIYLGMMRNLCFTHESTLHSGFPYFVIQLGLMPDDLTCLILYLIH